LLTQVIQDRQFLYTVQ